MPVVDICYGDTKAGARNVASCDEVHLRGGSGNASRFGVGAREAIQEDIAESIPGSQNSTCKGPEAGACLASFKRSKEASAGRVIEGQRSKR